MAVIGCDLLTKAIGHDLSREGGGEGSLMVTSKHSVCLMATVSLLCFTPPFMNSMKLVDPLHFIS